MRIFTRLVIVAALAWLGYILFSDARDYQKVEDADPTKIMLYFGGVILVGVAMGTIVAMSLIPAIGDAMGNFLFNPNEEVEKDPHAGAMAKVAQGDYEGAVEEYRTVVASNPSDTLALSEIAHLYCDRIGNDGAAAEVLESALQQEWPPDDSAFLCNRLVDVYWTYQHDGARARALLIQVVETLPDTKHAANAQHRLRDIDHAIETGQLPQRPVLHGKIPDHADADESEA